MTSHVLLVVMSNNFDVIYSSMLAVATFFNAFFQFILFTVFKRLINLSFESIIKLTEGINRMSFSFKVSLN